MHAAEEHRQSKRSSDILTSRKRSILLVDDEVNILLTLRMVFEREGYEVTTAESSVQALELLTCGEHFDAVITDLNMERDNIGLEVARAAVNTKPRPAVVICTGFASPNSTRKAVTIGIDYMADKPVELDHLIEALDQLIPWRPQSAEQGTNLCGSLD